MINDIAEKEAMISVSGNTIKSIKLDQNGICEFEFNGNKGTWRYLIRKSECWRWIRQHAQKAYAQIEEDREFL